MEAAAETIECSGICPFDGGFLSLFDECLFFTPSLIVRCCSSARSSFEVAAIKCEFDLSFI